MDELSALSALVTAADGRATAEPVVALGLALLSPWAGDRLNLKDEPNKSAPASPDVLFRFVGKVRDQLGSPLPPERGWLGWLRHSGLAMPLDDVQRCPAWVRDSALAGGWIALPPLGGFNGLDGGTIKRDGRLAALHILACQVGTDVPRDAVQVLTEWFVGPRAAEWSLASPAQCPTMVFPSYRKAPWRGTFRSLSPSEVVKVLCGVPHAATWAPPALTPGQRAERELMEMRRWATHENAVARREGRAPSQTPPPFLQTSGVSS